MPFVLLYLVVEIVALVALGSAIGLGWTLLVLLASALVGMWLARREGVRAAQAIAEAVSQRRAPHAELTDGMLVAAGGVLLFVPGLVTDVAGPAAPAAAGSPRGPQPARPRRRSSGSPSCARPASARAPRSSTATSSGPRPDVRVIETRPRPP